MPYRPRVLIVDDNPASQEMMAGYLSQCGYNVDIAGNGASALARLEGFRPHVVIMDLMMPCMTGRELIRRIRLDSRWHWMPILIASAACSAVISGAVEEGKRWDGGRILALQKPFEPEELLEALRVLAPERISLPEKYPPC